MRTETMAIELAVYRRTDATA